MNLVDNNRGSFRTTPPFNPDPYPGVFTTTPPFNPRGNERPHFQTMEINTDKHGLPNPDGTWGRNQTLPWDGTPGEMQPLGARIGNFLNNYEVAGSYGQQKDMPDYVYESLRRQMGPGYGFGDYKPEDMKNVINWNAGRLRI
tara:strand:- start:9009 stop:9434 length:426 start_codon:yes stop_codon:yes gene_type:complete